MFKDTPAFSGFSVDSLEDAATYYGKVLGLQVESDHMGMKILLHGGTEVFVYEKPNHTPADFTILNFAVEDIDAAVDALIVAGIRFETYEGMHQDEKAIARGKAAGMGPDIAWFKDPAGNILSVLEN